MSPCNAFWCHYSDFLTSSAYDICNITRDIAKFFFYRTKFNRQTLRFDITGIIQAIAYMNYSFQRCNGARFAAQ